MATDSAPFLDPRWNHLGPENRPIRRKKTNGANSGEPENTVEITPKTTKGLISPEQWKMIAKNPTRAWRQLVSDTITPLQASTKAYSIVEDNEYAEAIIKVPAEAWRILQTKAETYGYYVKVTIRRDENKQIPPHCEPYFNEHAIVWDSDNKPTKENADILSEKATRLGQAYTGMVYTKDRFGIRVDFDSYGTAQKLILPTPHQPTDESTGVIPTKICTCQGLPLQLSKKGVEQLLREVFATQAVAQREMRADTRH